MLNPAPGRFSLCYRTCFRREALEAAISEKDAHLALLEMTGIRNARQAEEVDRLKMDKRRLVERLKQEVNYIFSIPPFLTSIHNSVQV